MCVSEGRSPKSLCLGIEAVRAPAALKPWAIAAGAAIAGRAVFGHLDGMNQIDFLHLAGVDPQSLGLVLDLRHRDPFRGRCYRHPYISNKTQPIQALRLRSIIETPG